MAKRREPEGLTFVPVRPVRMDDLGAVLRSTWGSGCWCMYPRLNASLSRQLPGPGGAAERRRRAMTELAGRRRAPGLLAYRGGEPVGWVAVAPRAEFVRIDQSRATPRVDDVEVWVIPCVTVRRMARGEGVALALIRAAVAYAAEQGAPAVEAYVRAGEGRVHEDFAYHGTEPMFRKAGFRVVRAPLAGMPKRWAPRVTMRIPCRMSPRRAKRGGGAIAAKTRPRSRR